MMEIMPVKLLDVMISRNKKIHFSLYLLPLKVYITEVMETENPPW